MRTGAIYPNFGDGAALSGGSWNPNYPVTNLGDIFYPSHVARTTGAGAGAIAFTLTAGAQLVQAIALVAHTFQASDTMRLQLTLAGTTVADSGVIPVWPSGGPAGALKPTRPLVLNSAVTADAGRIDFTSAGVVEIGALDMGQFWRWKGVSFGRLFGFDPRNTTTTLAGGAVAVAKAVPPRTFSGQTDYIALGAPTNTVIDFQRDMDVQRPFVLVSDADDPTTWARMAFQATNSELPPLAGAAYRHDRFQFNMVENQR